jgi:hypothetical protein
VAEPYTPTTDETEAEVRRVMTPLIGWPRIDRWLAEVRREAAEKALMDAAERLVRDDLPADEWYAAWLRDVAAEYRKDTDHD